MVVVFVAGVRARRTRSPPRACAPERISMLQTMKAIALTSSRNWDRLMRNGLRFCQFGSSFRSRSIRCAHDLRGGGASQVARPAQRTPYGFPPQGGNVAEFRFSSAVLLAVLNRTLSEQSDAKRKIQDHSKTPSFPGLTRESRSIRSAAVCISKDNHPARRPTSAAIASPISLVPTAFMPLPAMSPVRMLSPSTLEIAFSTISAASTAFIE